MLSTRSLDGGPWGLLDPRIKLIFYAFSREKILKKSESHSSVPFLDIDKKPIHPLIAPRCYIHQKIGFIYIQKLMFSNTLTLTY